MKHIISYFVFPGLISNPYLGQEIHSAINKKAVRPMRKELHNSIEITGCLLDFAPVWHGKGSEELLSELTIAIRAIHPNVKITAGIFLTTIEYPPFWDEDVEKVLEGFKRKYS